MKAALTSKDIHPTRTAGRHVTDHAGLYLNISDKGVKSWVFRVRVNEGGESKPVNIGLGVYPQVSFDDAKRQAKVIAGKAASGAPVKIDRAAKASIREAARTGDDTFDAVAAVVIEVRKKKWKGDGKKAWINTLARYATPVIGAKSIPKITVDDIIDVLKRCGDKDETATRVRSRIQYVIDHFIAKHRLQIMNPAELKFVKFDWQPMEKSKRVKRQPSIKWHSMPAFIRDLRAIDGESARGLEFLILTGVRDNEVRFMTWDEIDFGLKVWTIPAARMKAGVQHSVPLAPRMIEILKAQPRIPGCPYVFTASREKARLGKPLSSGAFLQLCKPIREAGTYGYFVPHGFRASFRTWAAENNIANVEVRAATSAHKGDTDSVRTFYERTEFLELRRPVMLAWEKYLNSGGKVIALPKSKQRRSKVEIALRKVA